MVNQIERKVNMQQKIFVHQYQIEDDILELARHVSEAIVAAAGFVAQALLEIADALG
jgi:hypothetical protein